MPNDYRAANPKSSIGAASRGARTGGRNMNPMFLGIIIGLLLGIMLALGIAVWLNRSASPFQEKARPVDALPTIAAKPASAAKLEQAAGAGTVGAPTTKDGAEKPRFEFYDILPGEKNSSAKNAVKQPEIAAKSNSATPVLAETKRDTATSSTTSAAAKTASTATPTASKESYLLQAGAFQNESDAENLKAQIAFAGMEASIKSVNLPDKGTLFRVRLGPYKTLEEVNRVKTALSQNGINAAVVKTE